MQWIQGVGHGMGGDVYQLRLRRIGLEIIFIGLLAEEQLGTWEFFCQLVHLFFSTGQWIGHFRINRRVAKRKQLRGCGGRALGQTRGHTDRRRNRHRVALNQVFAIQP